MKLITILLSVTFLVGCVWLPITDSDNYKAGFDSLIGTAFNEDTRAILGFPAWRLRVNDSRYFLYAASNEYGFIATCIPGPFGGLACGGNFTGDQVSCIRVTVDSDNTITATDRKLGKTRMVRKQSAENLDCRLAYWSEDELSTIRRDHESRAGSGNRNAAMAMAEDYGEYGPAIRLSLSDRDVSLAKWLAIQFHVMEPLAELALVNDEAEREYLSALQSRYWNSKEEVAIFAKFGDPNAQFVEYLTDDVSQTRLSWLCKAADQSHAVAQHRLGDLYRSGDADLNKNLVLSYVWYRLASGHGFNAAQQALQDVQLGMSPDQKVLAEKTYSSWSPGRCQSEVEQNRKYRY